jgi:uncharacterized membrane protein
MVITMMLMLFIPLVLVAWVVTAVSLKPAAPAVAGGAAVEPKRDLGIDVLRERYVRGEIDRDEYQWRVLELLTSR